MTRKRQIEETTGPVYCVSQEDVTKTVEAYRTRAHVIREAARALDITRCTDAEKRAVEQEARAWEQAAVMLEELLPPF